MDNVEYSILRIYASSTDKVHGNLLYEDIVYRAKESGISGATVFRGVLGYGASSTIHTSRFWELTEKLPILIEIIDEKNKIETFYSQIEPVLKNMPKGCLVSIDPTQIRFYKSGIKKTD
ncbi:MAG TPA: DUF190 domain-containing protein [Bacteroidales bacterium]|nr:DUF190 domain-containing protein [Bacteroidales bacterium]